MQHLLSKELVEAVKSRTRAEVARAIDGGTDPHLAVILVGNDESSLRYISIKSRQAKAAGIILSLYHLEEDSGMPVVEEAVRFLNDDPDVHGIVIQLPLPEQFSQDDTEKLIRLVSPQKDVDGLRGDWQGVAHTRYDLESYFQPSPYSLPPMVCSVMSLLDWYKVDVGAKKVVLVGEGRLVGGPLLSYLRSLGQDVRSVNEETESIFSVTQQADILVSGTGQDDLITYQWVKEGAVVIDCAADVHEDSVIQVASALAPSHGGVGPLTVAWLLFNLAQSANRIAEDPSHA